MSSPFYDEYIHRIYFQETAKSPLKGETHKHSSGYSANKVQFQEPSQLGESCSKVRSRSSEPDITPSHTPSKGATAVDESRIAYKACRIRTETSLELDLGGIDDPGWELRSMVHSGVKIFSGRRHALFVKVKSNVEAVMNI